MSNEVCISCRRPKASIDCELCHEPVCKGCTRFLEEGTFSFRRKLPESLSHSRYCDPCFASEVEPALEAYREVMEQARGVYIFFTTQKRQPTILKKSNDSIRVEACDDRDETILRLAFMAVEQGYNAVLQVNVTSEKVRNEGYQTSRWRGIGIPAQVDAAKVERESARE